MAYISDDWLYFIEELGFFLVIKVLQQIHYKMTDKNNHFMKCQHLFHYT